MAAKRPDEVLRPPVTLKIYTIPVVKTYMLTGKCVVLGVSGGIAAYKACEIVSRLKKLGADVRVVMTQNAQKLVAPLTFETLSGHAVATDTFDHAYEIEHISLAKAADLFLIAPATANVIAKLAAGLGDDILTTTALAMTAPTAIAPAMNANMYRHPATQENLQRLASRGVTLIGPEKGRLACGDEDIGRMTEPDEIVRRVCDILTARRDFEGKSVLVTAGPTREPIDPVRFLSNRSTGKMGYALAEAAAARGAKVTLVSGPVSLNAPKGVTLVPIQTTLELYDAVTSRAEAMDVVIQAAAPADYRPAEVADRKIKKSDGEWALRLVNNPDVAAELGRRKRDGQILVAFAAETNDMLDNAQKKMGKKNADLIVANDVTQPGAGFAVDTNCVTLISREDTRPLPLMSKRETADAILDRVAELMNVE